MLDPFDWLEYLVLSEDLANNAKSEAALRSAISRAYYACYGKAHSFAESRGAALTSSGKDHKIVWDWFESRADDASVAVSLGGKRLKGWRRNADYHAVYPNVSVDVVRALIVARELLENLEDMITPRL